MEKGPLEVRKRKMEGGRERSGGTPKNQKEVGSQAVNGVHPTKKEQLSPLNGRGDGGQREGDL